MRPSVHLSVRLSPTWTHNSRPAAAGLLLWARRAGNIDRLLPGARLQRRANTGSFTLSAYVGSWTRACLKDSLLDLRIFGFYRAMLCTGGTSHRPVSVRVCHKSVFYRNGWTNRAGFWHVSFLPPRPTLCWKQIRFSPKIRALHSGTLS